MSIRKQIPLAHDPLIGIKKDINTSRVHLYYDARHINWEVPREMFPMKKLNYYLMKANRVIVWILLFFMILFIITGYALTKPSLIYSLTGGIINYQTAFYLHTTLDIPLLILLLVHVIIEIKFSLMRWGFKSKRLLNSLMLVLGLALLTLLFYVDRAIP